MPGTPVTCTISRSVAGPRRRPWGGESTGSWVPVPVRRHSQDAQLVLAGRTVGDPRVPCVMQRPSTTGVNHGTLATYVMLTAVSWTTCSFSIPSADPRPDRGGRCVTGVTRRGSGQWWKNARPPARGGQQPLGEHLRESKRQTVDIHSAVCGGADPVPRLRQRLGCYLPVDPPLSMRMHPPCSGSGAITAYLTKDADPDAKNSVGRCLGLSRIRPRIWHSPDAHGLTCMDSTEFGATSIRTQNQGSQGERIGLGGLFRPNGSAR